MLKTCTCIIVYDMRRLLYIHVQCLLHVLDYAGGYIMAYGSTPYVGMVPKKNGGHIKSAQITRSKCRCKISQRLP